MNTNVESMMDLLTCDSPLPEMWQLLSDGENHSRNQIDEFFIDEYEAVSEEDVKRVKTTISWVIAELAYMNLITFNRELASAKFVVGYQGKDEGYAFTAAGKAYHEIHPAIPARRSFFFKDFPAGTCKGALGFEDWYREGTCSSTRTLARYTRAQRQAERMEKVSNDA